MPWFDELLKDTAGADDTAIDAQLAGLRQELQSTLPEPDTTFLEFKGLGPGDAEPASTAGVSAAVVPPAAPGPGGLDKLDQKEGTKGRKVALMLVIGGLLIAVLAAGVTWGFMRFGQVSVPDLVGMSSAAAVDALNAAGLRAGEITEQEVVGVAAGIVVNTDPVVDRRVLRGTAVRLTVSAAGVRVMVPDVSGMTLEQAQTALSAARLTTAEVPTFDNTVPKGAVVGFLPTAGTELVAGSSVSVLVSRGSVDVPVEVPAVLGLSRETAENLLAGVGFNAVFYEASTSVGNLGEVVAIAPSSRSMVSPGSVVLVLVSRGNSTAELGVPDTVGKPRAAAEAAVSAAGFEPQVFEIADSAAATGTVVAQMPPVKGSPLLRAGEGLGLLVSHGATTVAKVPNVLSMDTTTAADVLQAAGFTPRAVPLVSLTAAGTTSGSVMQQFPAAGSDYRLGLPVVVYAPVKQ